MSEEALQIAVKRKEAKGKGEKESYKHLNAEFQRIARRDKKAFLSDQCKEIAENNRMGKTRDFFKKIRNTKGKFHAKMSTIKDRNIFIWIHQILVAAFGIFDLHCSMPTLSCSILDLVPLPGMEPGPPVLKA